jgi:YD repeat-containing protein
VKSEDDFDAPEMLAKAAYRRRKTWVVGILSLTGAALLGLTLSLVYGWLFAGDSGLPALIAVMGFLAFAFIFELVQRRFAARSGPAMSALTIALLLASTVLAAAQSQTTFRDASGRITGTVTTDSNGTRTFRDGSGRTTGTATRDSNGTTTFRDAGGRTTGTATAPRR